MSHSTLRSSLSATLLARPTDNSRFTVWKIDWWLFLCLHFDSSIIHLGYMGLDQSLLLNVKFYKRLSIITIHSTLQDFLGSTRFFLKEIIIVIISDLIRILRRNYLRVGSVTYRTWCDVAGRYYQIRNLVVWNHHGTTITTIIIITHSNHHHQVNILKNRWSQPERTKEERVRKNRKDYGLYRNM